MQTAETLACCALVQAIRSGAPYIYGAFICNADMRTGSPAFGTPEFAFGAQASGQMARHYAPRTPMELARGDGRSRVADLISNGVRVGWLTWPHCLPRIFRRGEGMVIYRALPYEAKAYAAGLYAALHSLDAAGCDRIVVAAPPDGPDWLAIRDRLQRAANPD